MTDAEARIRDRAEEGRYAAKWHGGEDPHRGRVEVVVVEPSPTLPDGTPIVRPSLPKGYAERKALPLYDFLTKYFPLALVEVTKIAVAGNAQHNPGEPLHWARGKSMDQLNTAMRHIFDHGMGNVYDTEPPEVEAKIGRTMHLAKAAWRLLAEIQLLCEARDREAAERPDR